MQDLGRAIEKLVAVGAALAFARCDLPGEDKDRRGHEREREPRRCGEDHERDDPEARVRGARGDLEEVGAADLAEPDPALRERGADIERDRIDEPTGDHHGDGERDDAAQRERVVRIGSDGVEDEDGDADVEDVEHRVGEVLHQVDAPPGPAREEHPRHEAGEQFMGIDEKEAHRQWNLGEREVRRFAVDPHLHEEEACAVAGRELDPPGDGAHEAGPLHVVQGKEPERGADQAEEDRERHQPLRAVEPSDPRPSARHEERLARNRDLAHLTPLRRVPLINVDLLSIHIQAPAEWRLDCVATSGLARPRERHSVVTRPERKYQM